jgi:DNA-binding beta-propeller fold protein YncE
VPGHPFSAIATADNCWLFVSIDSDKDDGAIAVLRNKDGLFALDHTFALKSNVYGESLSHDGTLLLVAANDDTAVLDVARLEQAEAHPLLGMLHNGAHAGAIYTAVSLDDKLLFVSNERAQSISVFDLAKARSNDSRDDALIGRIATAIAPVGLAFSPDGRWLYATSQSMPATAKTQATCKAEGQGGRVHPPGLLFRIDLAKAASDPAHAVAAALPAGCNPVRVAVSPSGKQLWVTARGDNSMLRFQADDWLGEARQARMDSFPIGTSPVGVAVRPDGKQVWVALSNRFGSDSAGQLAALVVGDDAAPMKRLSAPAPGFPREVGFLPDGRTLVATLFDAKQVQLILTPE